MVKKRKRCDRTFAGCFQVEHRVRPKYLSVTQKNKTKLRVLKVLAVTLLTLIKIVLATVRTSRKCVLNKQTFSEKGTPQLVI